MKFFVAFLALAAVASADVAHLVRSPEADAVVLRSENDVSPEGFAFAYETSNGISGQEVGQLKVISKDEQAVVVQGSNTYTAPNGEVIGLTYISDENGYQPQGAHLPTTPAPIPIPDYILRALDYIASRTQKEPLSRA